MCEHNPAGAAPTPWLLAAVAQSGSVSNDIRSSKEGLPQWRKHTTSEIKIFEDLFKSRISIDKITLFSLRPPEFRYIINTF